MVVAGLAVVVLLDDVVEGLVGGAEEEVGEVDSGEETCAVPGVVLEGAVVVGSVEAKRGNGLEGADVQTGADLVVAFDPGERVGVDEGVGVACRAEAVCVERADVVEIELWNAVVEEVLQTGKAKAVGEAFAVEAAAEGVGDELGLLPGGGLGVGDGVEGGDLVVPEGGSVNPAAAALGGDGDLAGLAELGVIHGTVGADLGDGFGGGEGVGDGGVAGRALDGDAVDRDLGLEGKAALE